MRKRSLLSVLTLLAALALSQEKLHAETLADRVPADALVYVQWAGSDALGNTYDNSNLKGLVDASNLPQLIAEQMEKKESGETDPQKAADMKTVHELIPLLVKAPAFYMGPVDVSVPHEPAFKIASIFRIGKADADKYAPILTEIIDRKQKENPNDKHPPVAVSSVDDYLLVTVGDTGDLSKRLTGAVPSDGLSSLDAYKSALAQVHANDSSAAVGYVNGDAALKNIDDAIASNGNPGMSRMWPMIEDALGIGAIRSIAWAGNFDGKNWHAEAFVALRQRRVGVVSFIDNGPVLADNLKVIPKSAVWAGLYRFDGNRLIDDLRNAFTAAGPNPSKQFEFGLQQFFAFTGVDLEKDLFASLGDQYAFYGTPDENGKSFDNFVIINKLKDPAKAETAIGSLESSASAMITQRNPNSPVQFATQPLAAPFDKITAHVITTPVVSPAWCVSDGNLYFAASLKALQTALTADKTTSILDNPTFAAARAKFPQATFSAFVYNDFTATAPELYDIINDALTQQKADHPDFTYSLPPLEKLTPYLSQTLGLFWTDTDGFHMAVNGPFPFSTTLDPESMIMRKWMMQVARRRRQPPAEIPLNPPAP